MLFPQPGHAVQYECRIKVTRRKLGYVLVLSNGTNTSVRVVSMGKLSLASPVRSRCIGDVNQDRDSAATRRQHTSNHHPLTSLGGGEETRGMAERPWSSLIDVLRTVLSVRTAGLETILPRLASRVCRAFAESKPETTSWGYTVVIGYSRKLGGGSKWSQTRSSDRIRRSISKIHRRRQYRHRQFVSSGGSL